MHQGSHLVGRREFLRAAGPAVLVGPLLLACGSKSGGPASSTSPIAPSTPAPTAAPVTVSGQIRETFTGAPIARCAVSIGSSSATPDASGRFSLSVVPDTWDMTVEGPDVRVKRVRTITVPFSDAQVHVDAIGADSTVDIDLYRSMCLSIGQVLPINLGGRSYRWRPGVSLTPLVVRDPRMSDVYYQAIDDARIIFAQLTRGIVRSNGTEFMDVTPAVVPEGAVVVTFPESNGYLGGPRETGPNWTIVNAVVEASVSLISRTDPSRVGRTFMHEYGHCLGLSHSSEAGSIMGVGNRGPSEADVACAFLKYSRNGGHVLSVEEDRD